MKINATYVSVWDGSDEVRTKCMIDLSTTPALVSDVETVNDSGDWSSLDKEFIELDNGEIIDTFTIEDDYQVIDGVKSDTDDVS